MTKPSRAKRIADLNATRQNFIRDAQRHLSAHAPELNNLGSDQHPSRVGTVGHRKMFEKVRNSYRPHSSCGNVQ